MDWIFAAPGGRSPNGDHRLKGRADYAAKRFHLFVRHTVLIVLPRLHFTAGFINLGVAGSNPAEGASPVTTSARLHQLG